MKRITISALSLAAVLVLAIAPTFALGDGNCCNGQSCCGHQCCHNHHK